MENVKKKHDLLILIALDSECFISDMDYKNNTIDELNGIASADLCQLECKKNPRCKMFSWISDTFKDSDYKQKCYLKDVDMEKSKMINDTGVVSGLRDCSKYRNFLIFNLFLSYCG